MKERLRGLLAIILVAGMIWQMPAFTKATSIDIIDEWEKTGLVVGAGNYNGTDYNVDLNGVVSQEEILFDASDTDVTARFYDSKSDYINNINPQDVTVSAKGYITVEREGNYRFAKVESGVAYFYRILGDPVRVYQCGGVSLIINNDVNIDTYEGVYLYPDEEKVTFSINEQTPGDGVRYVWSSTAYGSPETTLVDWNPANDVMSVEVRAANYPEGYSSASVKAAREYSLGVDDTTTWIEDNTYISKNENNKWAYTPFGSAEEVILGLENYKWLNLEGEEINVGSGFYMNQPIKAVPTYNIRIAENSSVIFAAQGSTYFAEGETIKLGLPQAQLASTKLFSIGGNLVELTYDETNGGYIYTVNSAHADADGNITIDLPNIVDSKSFYPFDIGSNTEGYGVNYDSDNLTVIVIDSNYGESNGKKGGYEFYGMVEGVETVLESDYNITSTKSVYFPSGYDRWLYKGVDTRDDVNVVRFKGVNAYTVSYEAPETTTAKYGDTLGDPFTNNTSIYEDVKMELSAPAQNDSGVNFSRWKAVNDDTEEEVEWSTISSSPATSQTVVFLVPDFNVTFTAMYGEVLVNIADGKDPITGEPITNVPRLPGESIEFVPAVYDNLSLYSVTVGGEQCTSFDGQSAIQLTQDGNYSYTVRADDATSGYVNISVEYCYELDLGDENAADMSGDSYTLSEGQYLRLKNTSNQDIEVSVFGESATLSANSNLGVDPEDRTTPVQFTYDDSKSPKFIIDYWRNMVDLTVENYIYATVNGQKKTGTVSIAEGETVQISPVDRGTGYRFNLWSFTNTETGEAVTIQQTVVQGQTTGTVSFVMPDFPITVAPIFWIEVTLKNGDGTADSDIYEFKRKDGETLSTSKLMYYPAGETVYIGMIDSQEGCKADPVRYNAVSGASLGSSDSFTMPDVPVRIEVAATYLVTINETDKIVSTSTGAEYQDHYFAPGTSIKVVATVPAGQKVTGWAYDEDVITSPSISELDNSFTFTVPSSPVSVLAILTDIDYHIYSSSDMTVTGEEGLPVEKFYAGMTVVITAPEKEGYAFAGWSVTNTAYEEMTNAVLSSPLDGQTSFTMPTFDLIISPRYTYVMPTFTYNSSIKLIRGMAYNFVEAGNKFSVANDITVYNGGFNFYVAEDGNYTFSEK